LSWEALRGEGACQKLAVGKVQDAGKWLSFGAAGGNPNWKSGESVLENIQAIRCIVVA